MASPPPKRQRCSTITLSDEDEEADEPRLPLRTSSPNHPIIQDATALLKSPPNSKSSKPKNVRKKVSPKSSPEKVKKPTRTKREPEKIKSLHTFFNRATEAQRWERKSITPDRDVGDGENGDVIEDDDALDDNLFVLTDQDQQNEVLNRRKLPISGNHANLSSTQRFPPSSVPKFVKPTPTVKRTFPPEPAFATQAQEPDHRPWADRYAPSNLEELAVNKKKVADVQRWLSDVLSGRDRRKLLVLKGPAGSGKSTTLSILAKALNCSVVSWSNPTANETGANPSIASQFGDFLSRSGHYGSLLFNDAAPDDNASVIASSRRILVVEEFPTTMTRFSLALDAFRTLLLQYISSPESLPASALFDQQLKAPSQPPLVLIITETLLTSTTAATDSFTAHRLLGPEIYTHPLVTMMEFNPVAPSFVAKALEIVVRKEARDSRRRRMPGPSVLSTLADMGDIRSAVNSLEFLCLRGDGNAEWSGTVASRSKRGSKEGVPLTLMERNSLELVSQREASLDMFHATGKVVYNKREDPQISNPQAQPAPKPPDHLIHFHKPSISQVDIDALLNEIGTDMQTFLSTLHENYILSCNGIHFTDSFERCSEFLSDSDALNPDSRSTFRNGRKNRNTTQHAFHSGSMDSLRQDEISFQVATRGLLLALPFPVNRAAHPGGRKSDSFKMFYPAYLRLWKPTEEVESLIAIYMNPWPQFGGSHFHRLPPAEGVASWQSRSATTFQTHQQHCETESDLSSDSSVRSYLSRDELTLETLPYLFIIKASHKEETKTLEKITQFHGLRITAEPSAEEEPFDADDETDHQEQQRRWPETGAGRLLPSSKLDVVDSTISQPTRPSSGANTRIADALSRFTQAQPQLQDSSWVRRGSYQTPLTTTVAVLPPAAAEEKLYISDDDIVDD